MDNELFVFLEVPETGALHNPDPKAEIVVSFNTHTAVLYFN